MTIIDKDNKKTERKSLIEHSLYFRARTHFSFCELYENVEHIPVHVYQYQIRLNTIRNGLNKPNLAEHVLHKSQKKIRQRIIVEYIGSFFLMFKFLCFHTFISYSEQFCMELIVR